MYLKELQLNRFRSCEETTVHFHEHLTILVGENNGGKSNIIDALRLCTQPLSDRRDRYCEDEDVRRGSSESSFELKALYGGLSPTLQGLLLSAVLKVGEDEACLGLKYEARSATHPRGRTTRWAGAHKGNEPEKGVAEHIRHVYLPALRDAQRQLGSGNPARVLALLKNYVDPSEEEAFLLAIKRQSGGTNKLGEINKDISANLEQLTDGVRKQAAEMDFHSETLTDVARDLQFRLADHGQDLTEIAASGLGYANLLYMATVMVELERAKDSDLTILLVEEPEAHLHPQLQAMVLEFLLEQAKKSSKTIVLPDEPEGRVQVVVTTHSPNLSAWVSPEHIVALRSACEAQTPSATHAIAVRKLGLKPKEIGKIGRYLDVTRSSLLFGHRALLVEGIAEALLLPVIARFCILAGKAADWRVFKGTALVAIDGVDFKPYISVLARTHCGARIADRVVVITDGDPEVAGDRKEGLESYAKEIKAGGVVEVFQNERTLEHELIEAGNLGIMKLAFLDVHPRSEQDWVDKVDGVAQGKQADALLALMKAKRTRKGDLAQALAQQIQADPTTFKTPQYIQDAILRVVG